MNSKYMKLAIEEAKKSKDSDGYWVGAVIIKDDIIISKSYSCEKNDNGHAEELAIKRCKENISGATMYITMEPCDIRPSGKKSCCDWIIESKIKKVIYGVLDPDTYVICNGIEKLVKAGIEVEHFKEFEGECKRLTPNLKFP